MTFVWPVLLALHLAAAGLLAAALLKERRGRSMGRPGAFLLHRAPEILLVVSLIPAVFAFIYAANASMDYVQRFIASGGNVRMAPDTARERLAVALRYGPLLLADLAWCLLARILRPRPPGPGTTAATAFVATWALALSLVSSLLFALSFPTFAASRGVPALAWVCLVPLFAVLEIVPLPWGLFYGAASYVVGSMLVNYWLGTYHLIALQFQAVGTAFEVIPFLAIALFIARRAGDARFLVLPMAWTVFDWLRSLGFLGYPWGIIGTTQYGSIAIIQIASLGGVWAVNFLVLLVNGVASWLLTGLLRGRRRSSAATLTLFAFFIATFAWGQWRLSQARRTDAGARTVRIALVQQNSDPRKSDYADTWASLRRLTTAALENPPGGRPPDLVAWSETAFVPNIRRWGAMRPEEHHYAALVREFLDWQKTLGVWLLTGNDDYELGAGGEEDRRDYNAAILFAPDGARVETYHKMHLVPFTEHFPWKRELPGLYALLRRFDVYLWEPGNRRIVFRHPSFAFSTPICYEDSFPDDVRRFVADGAEVIVNLSNDYWSLTETEAMQHAANAVFRAVENDRPLVRASASGLTCSVDRAGRILARAPFYEAAFLVVDVPVAAGRPTLYTRWGDWFPATLAALLALELLVGLLLRRRP